jgi:hypothetical protein
VEPATFELVAERAAISALARPRGQSLREARLSRVPAPRGRTRLAASLRGQWRGARAGARVIRTGGQAGRKEG